MPIYEFQCAPCRTVFSFFSRGVDTTTRPACPRCGRPLSREVESVAVLRGGGDGGDDGFGDIPVDESRMERAMDAMGSQLDAVGDSDDPRAAAAAMRSFSEASGLTFNRDIRDAIDRMASGEDPDAVGADLDTMMESGDSPFVSETGAGGAASRRTSPLPFRRDPVLYDMPDD